MVLFDLDGTLVDSAPDLAYCVDEMLTELGLPKRGEAAVRQWVGNGVSKLVQRALVGNLEGRPTEALFNQALPIFIDLYQQHYCRNSQLYPAVINVLDWMRQQSIKLGCVTNKSAQFTVPILKKLNIFEKFGVIVSGDTVTKPKPDPMPLRYVTDYFNLHSEQSLMVGDSAHDVVAARAAGMSIVCVSYGYNHGDDIQDSNPDAVIDSLLELADLFE